MSANDRQLGGEHYRSQPIQLWDFFIANNIPYLEASAIKYLARHARKNGREDLEKAIHFIEKMIETYYPEPLEVYAPCRHSWDFRYQSTPEGKMQELRVCVLCGVRGQ
jgi:Protein of unknwon function (DUF3310)